jgi:hypothetical protein
MPRGSTFPLDSLLPGVASVRSYGAVGDGVADDTLAVQAAAAAIQASGGGVLFFPPGTYRLSMANALHPAVLADFSGLAGVSICAAGATIVTADTFTGIGWTLFRFTECHNVEIRATFRGVEAFPATFERGVVFCRFRQNCRNGRIDAKVTGAAYGVWAGDYVTDSTGNSSGFDVSIDAYDVGYPVAFWESGINSTLRINAERTHRPLYIAGGRQVRAQVTTKDHEQAIIVTGNPVGAAATATAERGSEGIQLDVTDAGSTYQFADEVGRALALVACQSKAGAVTHRDIAISFRQTLTPASTAKAFGVVVGNTYEDTHNPNMRVQHLTISGSVDRAAVDGGTAGAIAYVGEPNVATGPILAGLRLRDISVRENPSAPATAGIEMHTPNLETDVLWENVRGITAPIKLAPPATAGRKHLFIGCDTATVQATSGLLADFTAKAAVAGL